MTGPLRKGLSYYTKDFGRTGAIFFDSLIFSSISSLLVCISIGAYKSKFPNKRGSGRR